MTRNTKVALAIKGSNLLDTSTIKVISYLTVVSIFLLKFYLWAYHTKHNKLTTHYVGFIMRTIKMMLFYNTLSVR